VKYFVSLRSPQLSKVLFILALLLAFPSALAAQSPEQSAATAEAIQTRIERARALVAAHQLETAASELESVRASNDDSSVRNITSVMLMNIYLEAGNYGRAEALLEENFRARSSQSGGNYFALAGQAVNGARLHLARYRSLGINTAATNLPAEAVADLEKVRSFLERMIVQAKEIAAERKAYDSLSLLEDVLGIRLSIARDADDQAKWSVDYAGARQILASQTQFTGSDALAVTPGKNATIKAPSPYSTRKTSDPAPKIEAKINQTNPQPVVPAAANPVTPANDPDQTVTDKVTDVGLLNFKASKRVLPRYPPLAKQTGTTGLVRVHVVVDETGRVVEVARTEGPLLLRQVAEDAARAWSFEGITGPGSTAHPGRFAGYIEFNFTL
jgi:TonB family protein